MKRDIYTLPQKIAAMLKIIVAAVFSIILIIVISVLHYIAVMLGLLNKTEPTNEDERNRQTCSNKNMWPPV